ncbi:4-hydroxyphenylpyruvate dioxygenase [hydrothermal vent metagenome]|uniref:4-hydroxyphenylpyruvate dioxygenase n=1 Tax=hydrothermal vent metagenome TaxID=652676 RepID=A0A3B0RX20_9ZZZZ
MVKYNPGNNPMGVDGFEFIEYASPRPEELRALFRRLGFKAVARHRSKDVTLYRQGDVNFLINAEPDSFAQRYAYAHGPSICSMAFRVKNAKVAYAHALANGGQPVPGDAGPMELNIPAIEGIGGSRLYLVDRYGDQTIYDVDFIPYTDEADADVVDCGMLMIDHLTHNVYQGRMSYWAEFYENIFNFRELKYFDIDGKKTGLTSKAMTSPCGKIHIPLNESKDGKSQIVEYLTEYRGEGIQHVAFGTNDIYSTVDRLRANDVSLQDTLDAYFDLIDDRIDRHDENIEELRKRRILIDGCEKDGILLQIFTDTVIGPIFFEIIQRKGNNGFGEGNFKALFESIELDQMRRGVI